MTIRKLLLWFVLIDFSAYTAWVLYVDGYIGLIQRALANPSTIQVALDLVIACTLIIMWMIADARKRGANALPFVLLTLCLGSIGPLCYLLRREYSLAEKNGAVPAMG